jgi:hypothetical protein
MVWYAILIVAVIAFIVWFVRTPGFRHHFRGRQDPGQGGSHVEGSMFNANREFRKND